MIWKVLYFRYATEPRKVGVKSKSSGNLLSRDDAVDFPSTHDTLLTQVPPPPSSRPGSVQGILLRDLCRKKCKD